MNPFMMGLSALSGIQNPDMFSTAMASLGVSPTAMGGAGSPPMDFSVFQPAFDALQGATGVPGTMTGTPTPDPRQAAFDAKFAPAMDVLRSLGGANSGLGGVKTPEPIKPIMSGGVANAQRVPETGAVRQSNSIQLLQQLFGGQGGAGGIPSLGSLFGGM